MPNWQADRQAEIEIVYEQLLSISEAHVYFIKEDFVLNLCLWLLIKTALYENDRKKKSTEIIALNCQLIS